MAPAAMALAQTIPNVLHELHTRDSQSDIDTHGFYQYDPSKGAAVLFAILFAIALIANLAQYFFYRAWFWWSLILAVAMEFVGFVGRVDSVNNPDSKGPFIIQTVFILIAPAVMAAACYQAFGRIVLWVTPPEYQSARHLWLPARRITPVFVVCDVLSFFIQVIGGATLAGASTSSKENLGKNIVLVGLALQLITFGFFVLASIRYTIVLRTTLRNVPLPTERNWRALLVAVNAASILILIRTLYRFIAYVLGTRNYLSDHEAFTYILDSTVMFLVAVLFICIHPGMYLPYLGIRRKQLRFSQNADRGLFSGLAKGKGGSTKPTDDQPLRMNAM